MGFGGFDSSIVLILRGGILMSIGNFPESLSQAMLVGIMLVGKLGVRSHPSGLAPEPREASRYYIIHEYYITLCYQCILVTHIYIYIYIYAQYVCIYIYIYTHMYII